MKEVKREGLESTYCAFSYCDRSVVLSPRQTPEDSALRAVMGLEGQGNDFPASYWYKKAVSQQDHFHFGRKQYFPVGDAQVKM